MSSKKTTQLTVLNEAPASDDLCMIVDVSDDSMSEDGTNKQITVANFLDDLPDDLPLEGAHYVIAQGYTLTDVQNACNAAAALSPSATSRVGVILLPGTYDFGTGDASNNGLVLDTAFVDLIGIGKPLLTSQIITAGKGTVQQTADNVGLYNLAIDNTGDDLSNAVAYYPETNLSLTVAENVEFRKSSGDGYSMRHTIEYSGTFTGCTGGNQAFGSFGTASGTFTGCTGGNDAFGGYSGTASGTFVNCTGDLVAFGGHNGTAPGDFNYCQGGESAWNDITGNVRHCIVERTVAEMEALAVDDDGIIAATVCTDGFIDYHAPEST